MSSPSRHLIRYALALLGTMVVAGMQLQGGGRDWTSLTPCTEGHRILLVQRSGTA
jgi:hypothetical protein